MAHALKDAEVKKTTGTLDGVQSPKDPSEHFAGLRIRLKDYQVIVNLIESLVALCYELVDDFLESVVVLLFAHRLARPRLELELANDTLHFVGHLG